jgi:tRNA(Leu) C34 or U34 (ribose-2'-O)-methylase TrmL
MVTAPESLATLITAISTHGTMARFCFQLGRRWELVEMARRASERKATRDAEAASRNRITLSDIEQVRKQLDAGVSAQTILDALAAKAREAKEEAKEREADALAEAGAARSLRKIEVLRHGF